MTNPPHAPGVGRNAGVYVDLSALVRVLRRHLLLLVALPVLGAIAGFVAFKLITPQYEVSVTLRPASNSNAGFSGISDSGRSLASLAGLDIGASDTKESSLAVLRSRTLGLALIDELDLLPVLFAKRRNADDSDWQVSGSEIPTRLDAWRMLNNELMTIDEERRSGNIFVKLRWYNRKAAANWANRLVALANQNLRQLAITRAEDSIRYLDAKLESTANANLKASIYGLIEQNIASITMANVNKDYAFVIVDAALAPDPEDYSWPSIVILVIGGFIAGLLVAPFIVLFDSRKEIVSR